MTLKEVMDQKSFNCSMLARGAKCAPQTISRIVAGKRSPSVRLAYKIAKVLGVVPVILPNGIEYRHRVHK